MEHRKEKVVYAVCDITCDVCGQSCLRDPKYTESYEYGTLKAEWGYLSERDMTREECHICEFCFNKVRAFIESLGGKVRSQESYPCA